MTETTSTNPYLDLRGMALSADAETLMIPLPTDRLHAFGIVIDIVADDSFSATLTGFRTGDASMYTSAGGGTIGGIGHECVRNSAVALIDEAEARIDDLSPTSETPLPSNGNVRFYVLTNKGKFFAEDSMENFFTGAGKFADLSAAANEVLTELRLIDESEMKNPGV